MSNATHGGKGDRDRTDRSKFENNWDKVFGRKEEEEDEMLLTIPLFDDELEEIDTTENFARKMREWNMMYDCLQNIHLYEYPIEEVKELLKQIKVS
tara:strand:- start:3447 stop:3734 length:288 start_codon:yes stop_codon:yes gene_type:complete